jgi:hypothetical protein
MRKGLYIIMFIVCLLLSGCAGQIQKQPEYSGFLDLKAGMWSEIVSKDDGRKVTTRTEVLEHSPSATRFQVIQSVDDYVSVMQFWIDNEKGRVTRYIIKEDGEVLCTDAGLLPSGMVPSDGSRFAPKQGITLDTYTTPGGKKIDIARFTSSSGEIWVSSEVPFGIVKMVSDGETVSSLYDFGMIGAKSRLSDDDVDSCSGATSFTGSRTTYQEVQDEEVDTGTTEEEYEGYREESDSYRTEVREAGTWDQGSIGCSACDQMPEAARNACLAACN